MFYQQSIKINSLYNLNVLRMRIHEPQAMYNTNRLNSVKADTYFISVIGIKFLITTNWTVPAFSGES